MRKFLRRLFLLVYLVLVGLGLYGALGYRDARAGGDDFRARADALIAAGQGAEALGADRVAMLLAVEDPTFFVHSGIDLTTPGAGATTITQSLSKRLGFDAFRPGIGKIRQTGFAFGLERELTKPQILALALETFEMGRFARDDIWITGFLAASEAAYGAPPSDVTEAQFLRLIAVLVSPGTLTGPGGTDQLDNRVQRISALLSGACAPRDHGDVWLEGCADRVRGPN